MLTKICLFLAILASAGTLALTHLKIDEKIKGLNASLETKTQEAATLATEKATLNTSLTKTKSDLEDTKGKLTQATKEAESANDKANKAVEEADKAKKETEVAKNETDEVKKSNKEYFDLGKKPDEIKKMFSDLAKTKTVLEATTGENKVLALNNKTLMAKVKAYEEMNIPGPAMPGLKASVIAVDPKWEFVIIDSGASKGALANGELKVNRGGQLVARIRIIKVENDHSVANVIAGSKTSEILEGDQVIY